MELSCTTSGRSGNYCKPIRKDFRSTGIWQICLGCNSDNTVHILSWVESPTVGEQWDDKAVSRTVMQLGTWKPEWMYLFEREVLCSLYIGCSGPGRNCANCGCREAMPSGHATCSLSAVCTFLLHAFGAWANDLYINTFLLRTGFSLSFGVKTYCCLFIIVALSYRDGFFLSAVTLIGLFS